MKINVIHRFLKENESQVTPIGEYILWSYPIWSHPISEIYDVLLRDGYVWKVKVSNLHIRSIRNAVKGNQLAPYPIYDITALLRSVSNTNVEIRNLYPQWFIQEILLYKLQE